jgi:hypothetical protein
VSGSGLQGSFTLQGNQAVSWNSFSGGAAAGAVTFLAFPQSCPTPGGPCGVTKGEFAINVGNEAVDVSSVNGINAIIAMDVSDGGATPWPSDPAGGQVGQNSGTLAGDKTAWGVFPYRCTQCTAIGDAPPTTCNPLGPAMQSYCKDGTESDPQPVVCQLNRTGAGGTVKFIFKGAADPLLVRGPARGQIRSGTAIQVGVAPARDGSGRGRLRISGAFAVDGPINLAAAGATVRILAGLNERGSGDDLVLDGVLTLASDARNTATTARFRTPPGETPAAEVTIGSRGRGQFTLLLDMSRTAIDVPEACPQPERRSLPSRRTARRGRSRTRPTRRRCGRG